MSVIDFTMDGKCSNCGACCSGVLPLSRAEVERIKRYLTQHPVKEQWHNGRTGIDMTCPFRDERNRVCLIYPVRPDICASFVCNYTPEDLHRAKMDFHKSREVVFMRDAFFGANVGEEYRKVVLEMLTGIRNGGAEE